MLKADQSIDGDIVDSRHPPSWLQQALDRRLDDILLWQFQPGPALTLANNNNESHATDVLEVYNLCLHHLLSNLSSTDSLTRQILSSAQSPYKIQKQIPQLLQALTFFTP